MFRFLAIVVSVVAAAHANPIEVHQNYTDNVHEHVTPGHNDSSPDKGSIDPRSEVQVHKNYSDDVCKDMTPRHGNLTAQTEASPFSISIDKESILPGGEVQVTLKSLNETEKFKGFFVQARSDKDEIVGTFPVNETNTGVLTKVRTIDCLGGEKNTVTQQDFYNKTEIQMNWLAPSNFSGNVVFKATIAKDFKTFWVAQNSSILVVGNN